MFYLVVWINFPKYVVYFLDIIDVHFLSSLPHPKYPELFNLPTCIMICFMGQCLTHLERTRNGLCGTKNFFVVVLELLNVALFKYQSVW